jgi:NAD(P)H-flavin reductase
MPGMNPDLLLGNCPKYLNKKHIIPHIPQPKLVSTTFPLPQTAVDLLAKADLFFISSSDHEADMDTNHRGGPAGFVRILSNDENGLTIVYPEYSGNRLYQTLGNLRKTPQAGLVFPDFDTGDVLYVTGTTDILTGKDASALISHTNLAVKIKVDALRFVTDGLSFRGQLGERSPYNPPIRYLSTEERLKISDNEKEAQAKLIDRQTLTPTISRLRFRITDPAKSSHWKPGQYVALSFQDELDIGYSHMRDDDPKSLNDDYLRTFTVSSRQDGPDGSDVFEITIRKVGTVTEHLFRHNMRFEIEVPLKGFGGEFYIQQGADENVGFIAGGVGITPLLAQAQDLDLKRLNLYWTVRGEDLGLVTNTFSRIPGLAQSTRLFVTGKIDSNGKEWKELEESGASLEKRRIMQDDFVGDTSSRYYLCTGTSFRNSVLGWLDSKTVLHEDFNY